MPSSTRRPAFKGCCGMCAAANGKVKGMGRAAREKPSERRLRGKNRRITRHEIPADQCF
jgi:hypothetical protein